MAEYYAVERSPEYLMHYGVKGMRWGVRRALKRGDERALQKHYKKAAKKLLKLSTHTNKNLMRIKYNQAKQNMFAGAAASGGLSAALTTSLNSHLGLKDQLLYGAGAGLAGAATGALINSKGIMSGRYLSDKGHAKAIKKRDQWQKDMRDAFKGTKYKKGSLTDTVADGLKTGLSNYSGAGPMVVPIMRSGKSKKRDIAMSISPRNQGASPGLSKLADRFESNYQKGLSRGMSHEQAETYANNKLSSPRRKRK